MKKVWLLIGLIMLIFTLYEIADSYAKYVSNATATAEKQAGAWVIKINDTNIATANTVTNFTIDSLTYPSNEYVLENKIAPSSSGYFDIAIDPSGSSVAIRYDVTLDLQELDISDAINFESACVVIDGSEVSGGLTRTAENTYTGIISLTDVANDEIITARFYIQWEEENDGENDQDDTTLGLTKGVTLELPIRVVVSQYSGETITEYN